MDEYEIARLIERPLQSPFATRSGGVSVESRIGAALFKPSKFELGAEYVRHETCKAPPVRVIDANAPLRLQIVF